MKMIGNVSDWLSYAGGALIKVADSAGSTVLYQNCIPHGLEDFTIGNSFQIMSYLHPLHTIPAVPDSIFFNL